MPLALFLYIAWPGWYLAEYQGSSKVAIPKAQILGQILYSRVWNRWAGNKCSAWKISQKE